jgi:hypothetical protein
MRILTLCLPLLHFYSNCPMALAPAKLGFSSRRNKAQNCVFLYAIPRIFMLLVSQAPRSTHETFSKLFVTKHLRGQYTV